MSLSDHVIYLILNMFQNSGNYCGSQKRCLLLLGRFNLWDSFCPLACARDFGGRASARYCLLLANPFPMGTANNCINCIDVCIDIDVFYNIFADNLPHPSTYFLCKIKDLKYKFNFFDEQTI